MKVKDLIEYLTTITEDSSEKADWPICVAFRWNGETVISDIVCANLNGKSIQFNEDKFYDLWREYRGE